MVVMEVLHICSAPMREAIARGVLDLVERGETSLTEAVTIIVDE